MLLLMLEKDMPIDCVIYADTGMEFPEMEAHIAKLDDLLCRERGIHITTLRHPHGFEWMMFEEPKQKPSCLERRARMGVPPYGGGGSIFRCSRRRFFRIGGDFYSRRF